jgi:small-conductance mechanosensitive channel
LGSPYRFFRSATVTLVLGGCGVGGGDLSAQVLDLAPDTVGQDTVAPDTVAQVDSIRALPDTTRAPSDTADRAAVLLALEHLTREVDALRSEQGVPDDPLSSLPRGSQALLRVLGALVAFVLSWWLIGRLVYLLDVQAERRQARRMLFKKLVPAVRIGGWILATYFIVAIVLSVDAQALLAAGAAVGVAVGFAAQDTLKNIFGGVIVVFDQPFQVGDKVSVGGTYGEVVSIGLRSTRLVTSDDNLVTVPNAQIVEGQVANANSGELHCQVVTTLFLPGWVDASRAKSLAREAALNSEFVYLNKPVVVLVKDEFRETFLLEIRVKAYVLDPRHEFLFQSDVTERARASFRDAGLLPEDHRFSDGDSLDLNPGRHEAPDSSEVS